MPAYTRLAPMVEGKIQPSYFRIIPKYKESLSLGNHKQFMYPNLPFQPASLPDHVVTTLKSLCVSPQSSICLGVSVSL